MTVSIFVVLVAVVVKITILRNYKWRSTVWDLIIYSELSEIMCSAIRLNKSLKSLSRIIGKKLYFSWSSEFCRLNFYTCYICVYRGLSGLKMDWRGIRLESILYKGLAHNKHSINAYYHH